jgi:hypothetical protein
VVTPNNLTGSQQAAELDCLAALASTQGAAIIADEVFVDYDLATDSASKPGIPLGGGPALTFSLGASKSIGLPQAAGVIAASGPDALAMMALARLEFAADATCRCRRQCRKAAELADADGSRGSKSSGVWLLIIATLSRASRRSPAARCSTLREAGTVLRVPAIASEEDLVLSLLVDDGVLTHLILF